MSLAVFFLLTFLAADLSAAIGSITQSLQQPGVIVRQNQNLPGAQGASLEMRDLIKTGAGSLGVTFNDNTVMQVTEHSRLLIDEFVYDPNVKANGKLVLKVALGTVRYASGAIAKNDPTKVSIKTPTATVGVRGTDFMSVVDELGRSTIVLLPSCPAGWVDISKDCVTGAVNVSTEVASVFMNRPFQATFVSNSDLAPSQPVVLNLPEDSIKTLIIVNQPADLKAAVSVNEKADRNALNVNALDINLLATTALANVLDADPAARALDQDLLPNLLDQQFVADVVSTVKKQIAVVPRIVVQSPAATAKSEASPASNSAKSGLDVPIDNGAGLDGDGSPGTVESSKLIAAVDSQHNLVQISRDGTTESQITITQPDGILTNLLNYGGSTRITIRQK